MLLALDVMLGLVNTERATLNRVSCFNLQLEQTYCLIHSLHLFSFIFGICEG